MDLNDPKPGTVFINGATGHEYVFISWHYVEYEAAVSRYAAWGSYCADCSTPIAVITPDRPRWFRRRCASCAEMNAVTTKKASPVRVPVQRLGAIERHIVEVANAKFRQVESVRYDEMVAAAVEALPAPEEGVRDSRRGRVVRALKNLSGKNGLIEVVNGRVIFME